MQWKFVEAVAASPPGRRWLPVLLAGAAAACGLAGPPAARSAPQRAPAAPAAIPLTAPDGKRQPLAKWEGKRATAVVFLGTRCPVANASSPTLRQLALRYRARGVAFVGVNSNPEETLSQVTAHARDFQLPFPVLKDDHQALARALGARVTPEVFVLDAQRRIRYRGRIDNAFATRTVRRRTVTSRDLEAALEDLLAGRRVRVAATQALGCAIVLPSSGVSSAASVTYHRDVAPILQQRCQDCHRSGQVAPFSLLTYSEARAWATEIKTFTQNRQMPPWKPEPGHGDFAGERRLTSAELDTLAQWVDAGAPEGNPREAPAPRQFPDGWMLGTPDLVLQVAEPFHVEATGEDLFRAFVLPTNLDEDRQVVAVEVRPGNPRVVHHVLNFIDTTGQARRLDARDPASGYRAPAGGVGFLPSGELGGWAPGNFPRFSPPGTGRLLPKGSDLVIQVHYHRTGKPETDQTTIGLYFAREPVTRQVRTWPLASLAIDIPPGAARHEVRGGMRVPVDVQVISILPHMHLLGKEMKVTATLPDGTTRSLVWIKDWDYRWQDTYRYREPLLLPRGTRLELVAYYDNSSNNPRNPSNPPRRVTFGEETTDEMCFAFLEYLLVDEPPGLPRLQGLFGRRGLLAPGVGR